MSCFLCKKVLPTTAPERYSLGCGHGVHMTCMIYCITHRAATKKDDDGPSISRCPQCEYVQSHMTVGQMPLSNHTRFSNHCHLTTTCTEKVRDLQDELRVAGDVARDTEDMLSGLRQQCTEATRRITALQARDVAWHQTSSARWEKVWESHRLLLDEERQASRLAAGILERITETTLRYTAERERAIDQIDRIHTLRGQGGEKQHLV